MSSVGQSDSSCGHDGWQAGCPNWNCERQHRLALELIGEHDEKPELEISHLAEGWDADADWQGA